MTRAATELMQVAKERREKAKTRTPWRHRKKAQYKLTNIQKAQRKVANLDRKETLNQLLQDARDRVMEMAGEMQKRFPRHSEKYYFRLIMQDSRLNAKSRNPSRWNAFLSQEMERRNSGLTDGRKNISQDAVIQEIAAAWRSLTKEEQIAATEERLQTIADRRSVRKRKIPTAPIQAFHDARATTQSIENELRALNVRTGRNALLIMTSPSATDYGQPYVFHTSPRIVDFMMLTMRSTLPEFTIKMEGYILSGVQGVKQNYRQTIISLKKEAARVINEKLGEVSGGAVTRMMYKNFDVHVTENTGIIVERWPLPVFRAPGDISSSVELQTLIDAWTTGATYFRIMGEDELREWRCRRRGLQGPSVVDSVSASSTSSVPPQAAPSEIELPPSTSPAVPSPASSPPSSATPATSSTSTPPAASTPLPTGFPPAATTTVSPAVTTSATSLAPSPFAPVSPSPSSAPDVLTASIATIQTQFINVNVVTGPDGRQLAVTSRQRKTRSDKGTRKRKSTDGDTSAPPATGSKSRKKKASKA
ncbi:hypothetical protein LXA43DRAFT_1060201 [Ganoderma leucocontextum]|nr:hypothetical protein LXA43DRAFT_1060201 [Ganoderma leucocontextum]